MKKLYSVMLTAAATLAATAAPKFTATEPTFEGEARFAETPALSVASRAASTMDEVSYPTSLTGKMATVNFTIREKATDGTYNYYPVTSNVSFTNEEEEDGVLYYEMENFLAPHYSTNASLTDFVDPIEVAYIPSAGYFYILGQTFFHYTYQGNQYDAEMWAANASNNCVSTNYRFEYEDGTFTFVNPFQVQYQGEDEPETFDANRFIFALLIDNSLASVITITSDISIDIIDGTGEMTYQMDHSAHPTQPGISDFTDPVGVKVNGNTVTITNWADMGFNVPMTMDAEANTLTAENVQCTYITSYKAYLSEQAADGANAAGTKKYVLTSTYNVADGKTTITVPNWNAFYYQFGTGEQYYFFPMINTTIELDMELPYNDAGVEAIAVDNSNAPVEYYNLQGIRVSNPEAGQLLIQRQGNKATKVVIR